MSGDLGDAAGWTLDGLLGRCLVRSIRGRLLLELTVVWGCCSSVSIVVSTGLALVGPINGLAFAGYLLVNDRWCCEWLPSGVILTGLHPCWVARLSIR